MPVDLRTAVDTVATALSALLADPASPQVRAAIVLAARAVDALDRGVTAVVLHRLVTSIDDCHRMGVRHSDRLAARRRSTSIALRLDPRWTDRADPLASR